MYAGLSWYTTICFYFFPFLLVWSSLRQLPYIMQYMSVSISLSLQGPRWVLEVCRPTEGSTSGSRARGVARSPTPPLLPSVLMDWRVAVVRCRCSKREPQVAVCSSHFLYIKVSILLRRPRIRSRPQLMFLLCFSYVQLIHMAATDESNTARCIIFV